MPDSSSIREAAGRVGGRRFQSRSVYRRDRIDHVGIRHAGRPLRIVIDHHFGELIVIEAEDDMTNWILRRR